MTTPLNAVATTSGRFYNVPGFSTDLVSVTNVLGIISAPAITAAAARKAAECAVRDAGLWKQMAEEEGEASAIAYIKEASTRHMVSRGDIGTAVHHACEQLVAGAYEPDEETAPYLDAYQRWIDRDAPEFIAVEQTVFDPDPEIAYAGTADMIVRMGGRTYIGDIKTGFVPSKAALQMCAYARAPYRVTGDASSHVPWSVDGAFVVDLKPGKFNIRYCDIGEETWRAFRSALTLWKFNQRKDVFSGRYR